MTFDELKSKILNFLNLLKEKICDFFAPLNKALFGTNEQDCSESEESYENEKSEKESSNENAKKSRKDTSTENYENQYEQKSKEQIGIGQKIKSYIPLVADFIASLFYIAVVVLVLKPSLLVRPPFSLLDKLIKLIGSLVPHLQNIFPQIVYYLISYIFIKLLVISLSKIIFRKIVPVLLVVLQILCLGLLLIKFKNDEIQPISNLLLFSPFALLVYIIFQQVVGCSSTVIKKKLKLLIMFSIIGYIAAHIMFCDESREHAKLFCSSLCSFIKTLEISQK